MMFNLKKKQKRASRISSESGAGFTMIEMIVAIAILSFGIIGVYNAFFPFISLNNTLFSRFTAAYLAQDGLEIVRNIRDDNFLKRINPSAQWSDNLLGCALGCQADYKAGTIVQTPYNQLKAYDPNAFLKLSVDGTYNYELGGTDTLFKRKITITQDSGTDTLKVVVLVAWTYDSQPFTFEAEEYLYNWF